MGRYDDYVYITDLDGTLLNSEGKLSQENIAAIKRFTDGGGHFCVATGRTPDNAKDYLGGLVVNTACIFHNGAMLYDYKQDKIIHTITLQGETWRDFAALVARKHPYLKMQIFVADTAYAIDGQDPADPFWERIEHKLAFSDLATIRDMEWLKIIFLSQPEELQGMLADAREMGLYDIGNGFFAAHDCYEFVSRDASKGHMLKFLREMPENAGRQVIAQGDYGNDTYMLQMADVGIAPANAYEETKKAADIVGVSCDESLAAYVVDLIDAGKI